MHSSARRIKKAKVQYIRICKENKENYNDFFSFFTSRQVDQFQLQNNEADRPVDFY